MNEEITRDEFAARFKAELLRYATTFSGGESVADYADMAAVAYWDDADMRAEGPEACAQADMECWDG